MGKSKSKSTIKSGGIELPEPMTGSNSTTSDSQFSDKDRMKTHNNTNQKR